MKYILLLTATLIGSSIMVQGQSTTPHFNLGVGVSSISIPIYASYDFPVAPDIHVGVGAALLALGNRNGGGVAVGLSGSALYYANRILELPSEYDVYGGAELGLTTYRGAGLRLGLLVGGRYYFRNDLGINLELGSSLNISNARIGVTWRM